MWEHWKAIRETSQLQCPMDGFSSQAWLSSTQTNGESLNELDLHMILISFPGLKASINCLEKINGGGIDAAQELKRCPHAADSLAIKPEEPDTHTHTKAALVYKCHIDAPAPSLGVCSCLTRRPLTFVPEQPSSRLTWRRRSPQTRTKSSTGTKMFDPTDSDEFSSINLTV